MRFNSWVPALALGLILGSEFRPGVLEVVVVVFALGAVAALARRAGGRERVGHA